jgi:hypothetical protein
MNKTKRFLITTVLTVLVLSFMGTVNGAVSTGKLPDSQPVADEMIGSSGITWVPKISFAQLLLTVARPDGTHFSKTFTGGSTPYIDLSNLYGDNSSDGTYTYELRVTPVGDKKVIIGDGFGIADKQSMRQKPLTQTGYFRVQGGMIVTNRAPERLDRTSDVVHGDDVIITGGLCVGADCVDGESFFDTMKLKDLSLSIYFQDTSSTSTWPTNDWRILINDTSETGADYFSIEDSETANRLFTLEAGAPDNSLYVDSWGWVGLGTSVPYANLHIVDGYIPNVRLNQDISLGNPAYSWEMAADHTGFAIVDATNYWNIPFFIESNSPPATLFLASDGKVGIGTSSPGYSLEVETTGENSAVVSDRTDGAKVFMNATATYGQFGTVSNHDLRMLVNSRWKMALSSDNSLSMASGASCTAGGTWTNASSRALKENIQSLDTEEALNTINNLNPVKFNYKVDKAEKHVGFIAEDAPELVSTPDRKGMSPMDVVAVLTKVVQEQQKFIQVQQKINAELQKKIAELETK